MSGLRWRHSADRWAALAAAVLYCVFMLGFYSFRDTFEFNQDEGTEVMKAAMLERGAALYNPLWNDQPPVFTYVLLWAFRALGSDVVTGRLVVLFFASCLIFAMYDSVRLQWGHAAALAAVALLPCTTYFPKLSVSAMAGLPAIALATIAVWALFRWESSGRGWWVPVSGAFMGLSLMTKLFTVFLLPVVGLWVLLMAWRRRSDTAVHRNDRVWRPCVLWAVGLLVTTVCLTSWARISW